METVAIIILSVSVVLSSINQILLASTTKRLWQQQQRQQKQLEQLQKGRSE